MEPRGHKPAPPPKAIIFCKFRAEEITRIIEELCNPDCVTCLNEVNVFECWFILLPNFPMEIM